MFHGKKPIIFGWLNNIAAQYGRQAEVTAQQLPVIVRQKDDLSQRLYHCERRAAETGADSRPGAGYHTWRDTRYSHTVCRPVGTETFIFLDGWC